MKKIGIIGAGNVGRVIARVLQEANLAICGITSKNGGSAAALAEELGTHVIADWQEFAGADLILVAVPDTAVHHVISEAASIAPCASVSGTASIHGLKTPFPVGVFYPLQSFSVNRTIPFSDVPILIESADEPFQELLLDLGKRISKTVQLCSEEDRKNLHIAAVFANNFTNHLLYQAEQYCKQHGVSFELLKPLIRETIDKACAIGPYSAQTGPARRNDQTTITEHLSKLSGEARELYRIMSENIQSTYK